MKLHELQHKRLGKGMTRQVVVDTETTGLDFKTGDRVIELGCVELINRKLTGRHLHFYFNPDRIVEEAALKIHGISNEFLQDKPRFFELADEVMEFLKGAELIIHNAEFDVGFINNELSMLLRNPYGVIQDNCEILDTLAFARQLHPGQRNSLDALCKRYQINNSHRKLHGALLDAEILAELYLVMTGGQEALFVEEKTAEAETYDIASPKLANKTYQLPFVKASEEESAAHEAYLTKITQA